MNDIAILAKHLHTYFPGGYVAISPLLIVHADGRSVFGYALDIQQINVYKNFNTFQELKKYAVNLMLTKYAMPAEKLLMFSDFEKST